MGRNDLHAKHVGSNSGAVTTMKVFTGNPQSDAMKVFTGNPQSDAMNEPFMRPKGTRRFIFYPEIMIPASVIANSRRRRCTPLSQQPIVVTIDLPPPITRRTPVTPTPPPVSFTFSTNVNGIVGVDVVDDVTFFSLSTGETIPSVPALAVYFFNGQISGTIDNLPPLSPPIELQVQIAVRVNGVVATIIGPPTMVTINSTNEPFTLPFLQTENGIFVDPSDVVTFDLEVFYPGDVSPSFFATINPISTVGIVSADNIATVPPPAPFTRRNRAL